MSGFIHIAHETPPWLVALRTGAVAAGALALVWLALSDEGLPIAPPGGAAEPFVRPRPLPAPPPVQLAARLPDGEADDVAREAEPPSASAAPDAASPDADDYATRNAAIDVRTLTLSRPLAARTFLSEVLLKPGSPHGYVVAEVLPESRYERMGLRPGDVVYTLDTPGTPGVDESSMVALIGQTDLEIEVYRGGTLTRLHTNLAKMENGDVLPP